MYSLILQVIVVGYRHLKNCAFRSVMLAFPVSPAWRGVASICNRLVSTTLIVIFPNDLSAKVHECFIDVCSSPSASLKVRNIPFTRNCKCSWAGYGSIFFEIRLIANEDHGDVVIFFDTAYLLSQFCKLIERRL